jgi:hypothetical protein
VLFKAVPRILVSQLIVSRSYEDERMNLPIDEIGMDTETGGVTVGPGEVASGSNSRGPSRGLEGVLEHDLRKSDWVTPWALTTSDVAADRVDDVRSVALV